MNQEFIGRKREIAILEKALTSNSAEMVAVIGRRRVGKTFLVRTAYKDKIDLEITGVQNTNTKTQIENFHYLVSSLNTNQNPLPIPKNWMEAFRQLIQILEQQKK